MKSMCHWNMSFIWLNTSSFTLRQGNLVLVVEVKVKVVIAGQLDLDLLEGMRIVDFHPQFLCLPRLLPIEQLQAESENLLEKQPGPVVETRILQIYSLDLRCCQDITRDIEHLLNDTFPR
jgi:hypothetical protein